MHPLAQEYVALFQSDDPQNTCAYSPGICRCDDGRLVATMDIGSLRKNEKPNPDGSPKPAHEGLFCRVMTSDDGGRKWDKRANLDLYHGRPFKAGKSLYVIGHRGDLRIARSDDNGATWSEISTLTEGEFWHQAPANVWHANGCIYLVMERRKYDAVEGWYPSELQPILMRGRIGDDLTQPDCWVYAETPAFHDVVNDAGFEGFGIPFYSGRYPEVSLEDNGKRPAAPIGWLETNVVPILDPNHVWHDPDGRTLHLWMRAHTGMTNYCMVARVREAGPNLGEGKMKFEFESAPSGVRLHHLPMPGGQMKFHLLFDENTKTYWLLSSQSTDSMRRLDAMPADRFGLADNQRSRLQLHFSTNMVDWIFAGMVAVGETENCARHYASMAIDGEDLVVLSRSGDRNARNAHDTNMITFHRIKDFRSLIY
ncbi:MAG: exo-alpha-sialidase [Verrucomicrobia bacterium]|nr:MAG: exo-alpha-sialidase [Verrucomicrobiota bacterium]